MNKDPQQALFSFLNNTDFDTDPIADDRALKRRYQRTTTKPLKQVRIDNLHSQPQLFKDFYSLPQRQDDNSQRIITDIRPMTQYTSILPKTAAHTLRGMSINSDEVRKNLNGVVVKAKSADQIEAYLKDGTKAIYVLKDETQKLDAINALEKWKLTNYQAAINDLAAGLIKQISNGAAFEGIRPQFVEYTDIDGNGNSVQRKLIISWLVTMTWAQIKKCTFGGLVDDYGNYRYGTAEILRRTTEKELIAFLDQTSPLPVLQYYRKNEQGLLLCGEYAPIKILDKNQYVVTLELDRRYFPFDFTDKGEPTGIQHSRYIISPAGIGSIIRIGHAHLAGKGVRGLPSPLTANRYFQTLTGAFQFQSLLGIKIQNSFTDKENVAVRRNGIYKVLQEGNKEKQITEIEAQKNWTEKRTGADITIDPRGVVINDLFPKEQRKREWALMQERGILIGRIIMDGLETTGLARELKASPHAKEILIPSTKTGMQYFTAYPNLVMAKVEPIANL